MPPQAGKTAQNSPQHISKAEDASKCGEKKQGELNVKRVIGHQVVVLVSAGELTATRKAHMEAIYILVNRRIH